MRPRHIVPALFAIVAASAGDGVARGDPLFRDQPGIFGTQACNGAGCWTNYAQMADLDGDGNLDIVLVNCGGFFSPMSEAQPLKIYYGDGAGHLSDASSRAVMDFTGRVRQVALGDVDGDGHLDMFAPDANGGPSRLFMNQKNGAFVDDAADRLGMIQTHAGATRFADVDGDGDLDLWIADGFAGANTLPVHLYLNDGKGHFTEAPAGTLPALSAINVDDLDVLDVDGDYDLDLLINVHQGDDILLVNDGAGHFTNGSAGLPHQNPGAYHYNPAVCDVNGDGYPDIVIDNVGPNLTEQLLVNRGDGTFIDESEKLSGNTTEDDNGVSCIDYDGDGSFDLVVASLTSKGERVFHNDGTGSFTLVPLAFPPIVDGTLWMDFGDLDGDGRLDAVSAQGEKTMLDRVYFGTTAVAVDTRAPKIIGQSKTTTDVSGDTVVLFSVSDNAVTDVGPRLKRAWVKAGTATAEATFMGGDLFRAVVRDKVVAPRTKLIACAEDRAGNMQPECHVEAPKPRATPASVRGGCSCALSGTDGTPGSLALGVAVGLAAVSRRLHATSSSRRISR